LLHTPTELRTRTSAGIILMCVGVASLCVNDALAKTLTAHYSPFQIQFLRNLIALPFADPLAIPGRDFGIIAFQGLIQMPVALVLFFAGTRYTPAAEVALMSLLETILGPIWAWLGVGEVPPAASVLGGAIVVAAIALNALAAMLGPRSHAAERPAPVPPPPG